MDAAANACMNMLSMADASSMTQVRRVRLAKYTGRLEDHALRAYLCILKSVCTRQIGKMWTPLDTFWYTVLCALIAVDGRVWVRNHAFENDSCFLPHRFFPCLKSQQI